MAIEEVNFNINLNKIQWFLIISLIQEFGVEIPDVEADAIQTVEQGSNYTKLRTDAHYSFFSDRVYREDS